MSKKFEKSPIEHIPSEGYTRQDQYSDISIQWLEWRMQKENKFIRHALNHPDGEKMILANGHHYRVDGFCEKTKTVYEYHGCYFHGCVTCYPRSGHEKHRKTE